MSINILHLSDLHFGRIDSAVLEKLKQFIEQNRGTISLTILTGDLTQRAKTREFKDAKAFLDSLNCPLFLVPGNHDIPLFNIFERFSGPYKKFMEHIHPYTQNYYEDENIAVFGLWTAELLSSGSRLRPQDLTELQAKFKALPEHKIKIIAAHHPLSSLPHGFQELLKVNPHCMLWGHDHHGKAWKLSENQPLPVMVASGTSISSRTRLQSNSFNTIKIIPGLIEVKVHQFVNEQNDFSVVETFRSSF